jgi:cytochrome c oxidase subunit 1
MFATGAILLAFFSFTTFLIACHRDQVRQLIGTMWGGSDHFETPMLFAVGFPRHVPVRRAHRVSCSAPRRWTSTSTTPTSSSGTSTTCFSARSCSPFFAASTSVFPKMTGMFLDEGLGRIHF